MIRFGEYRATGHSPKVSTLTLNQTKFNKNMYIKGNPSRRTEVKFNTYYVIHGTRLYRKSLLDRPRTPFQEAFSRRSRS